MEAAVASMSFSQMAVFPSNLCRALERHLLRTKLGEVERLQDNVHSDEPRLTNFGMPVPFAHCVNESVPPTALVQI